MKSSATLITAAILLTVPALLPSGRTQDKPDAKAAKHSRFDQFKALEGEWAGSAGKVTYHVTSGGSAVVETISPGSQEEMVTMITKDGPNIALTHYCHLGNQPHMQAPDLDSSNAVAFKFVRGGNMTSEQDMHMHNVTYTFVDKDTLKADWTLYTKGKASNTMTFEMTRAKK